MKSPLGWHDSYLRWLYRSGSPSRLAKWLYLKPMNRISRLGWFDRLVTLEVVGRKSGLICEFPLVILRRDGHDYLVSMLGEKANWVRNVAAFDGRAVLREGRRRRLVKLERVTPDPEVCAPLLQAYLQVAPGARPHIPVPWDAPVTDFLPVAARYPIFEVLPGLE